jgi:hypothetical protein
LITAAAGSGCHEQQIRGRQEQVFTVDRCRVLRRQKIGSLGMDQKKFLLEILSYVFERRLNRAKILLARACVGLRLCQQGLRAADVV